MPVGIASYNPPSQPQQKQEEDSLDKLLKIANLAQAGAGIYKAFKPEDQTTKDQKKADLEYKQAETKKVNAELEKPPKTELSADANSDVSKHQQDLHKQALGSNPAFQGIKWSTFSEKDLDHFDKNVFGKQISGEYGLEGKKVYAGAMSGRAETQKDNQAMTAVSKIHDDPVLRQMKGNAFNIEKARDLMGDPDRPPSNKAMAEVSQDIAAALSGSKASSDFKLKQMETPTIQGYMANITSLATSNPDQPAPPDVVKYWRMMGDRLAISYQQQMSAQASNRLSGMKTALKHNPSAFDAAKEAVDQYKTGAWKGNEGLNTAPIQSGPPINADLSKMTPAQLQEYINAHGGQ